MASDEPSVRNQFIDEMISTAKDTALVYTKAHLWMKESKEMEANVLTPKEKYRVDAEKMDSAEIYRHPMAEVDWDMQDFSDEIAEAQRQADYPTEEMLEKYAKARANINFYKRMVDAKTEELFAPAEQARK